MTLYREVDPNVYVAENNGLKKQIRKLQDQINRYNKLIPGASRIWTMDRIVMEMRSEADRLREEQVPYSNPDGLDQDAIYLERLAYDMISLRDAMGRPVRGTKNRKYDPTQWPRGPRP
jgi:hypothetical protein